MIDILGRKQRNKEMSSLLKIVAKGYSLKLNCRYTYAFGKCLHTN